MNSLRTSRAGGSRRRERGQVTVEFALILPLFLILVFGIIKFGIAINYWLDMQRVANQGARWAAVNRYPIASTGTYCADNGGTLTAGCSTASLVQVLAGSKVAVGETLTPCIYFPSTTGPGNTPQVGDPVNVTIKRHLSLGIPFIPLGVTVSGKATMRLEQTPTVFTYTTANNAPC
jgi:Flp pilus assembly protein TadG